MEDIKGLAEELKTQIDSALNKLAINDQRQKLNEIKIKTTETNFWEDSIKAQEVMKQIASIELRIKPWEEISSSINEVYELINLKDESLKNELDTQLNTIKEKFTNLKQDLKFNGPYDNHAAILSIYAGAGGTDAQDWAQMLLRMYSRYFDKNNYKVKTVDESPGEEAGLKSITLEVEGPLVYGKLKGEHGVHRLVRLSPYNADNLRQTSFAKVEIMPMLTQPNELLIEDKDLKIDVYRSGGHGGQSVNTTDSAVRVTHIPTGLVVAIQNERSQTQNKETAMTILRSKLAQLQIDQHQEKLSELKGPNQSAEWGNQIRSYVLHPYKQVKDLRTRYESSDPDSVLDGDIDGFIEAFLEYSMK